MARSVLQLALLCACVLLLPTLWLLHSAAPGAAPDVRLQSHNLQLHGEIIMPKLENATAKAELGRASWRLLHVMAQRYPEHPSADEREALNSFLHLFARLYPCGECAAEFQHLLATYPPQTSSRTAAAMWACSMHNRVNERLGKPEFDCADLEGQYDCGCGDDKVKPAPGGRRDPVTGERLVGG